MPLGLRYMLARERWALLVVAVVIAASVLSVCDWMFDCGCRAPWAGAAAHCDIHVAGAPDCPLCVGSVRFPIVAAMMVLGALAAIVAVSRKLTPRFGALVAAGVAGYLLVAAAAGVILGAL